MPFAFSLENQQKFQELLSRYPEKQAAMLPALWLAQRQNGWISPEVMEHIAALLGLTPAKVYEVVTFYTMFYLKPPPRYHFQVCRTLPCQLRGAEGITRYLCEKLSLRPGVQSEDDRYLLTEVECLGSCGTAPMLQLNDDFHENLTPERLDLLVESLK